MTDQELQVHMLKAVQRRETAEKDAEDARLALVEYAKIARGRGWSLRYIAGFVGVSHQRLSAWVAI